MARFLVVFSFLLFTYAALVLGQDDCSNPPVKIINNGCCEPPKWTETDAIDNCDETGSMFCYAECIFKETNIAKNGEMQLANVKALFEAELKKDPDYIPVAIKAFEKCYPMIKQRMAGKTPQVDGCSAMAAAVIECTNTQIFVNCPAKKWKTSGDCEALKKFLAKCPSPNFSVKN